MYSTISQKCIGPDMFSWIRHYLAEVCAPPSALLVYYYLFYPSQLDVITWLSLLHAVCTLLQYLLAVHAQNNCHENFHYAWIC